MTVVVPSETQSTSSSIACSRNLSIRIGLPSDAATASPTYLSSSPSVATIAMPRPPRTKLGRTSTG